MACLVTYRRSTRKKVPKTPFGKPRYRKIQQEKVCDLVRDIISSKKEEFLRTAKDGVPSGRLTVTAEELATELNVEIHNVTLALKQLNLQGLVGQRINFCSFEWRPGHRRFPTDDGTGWRASEYLIILPDSEYNDTEPLSRPDQCPEGVIPVWDDIELPKPGRFSKRLGCRMGEQYEAGNDRGNDNRTCDRNRHRRNSNGILFAKGRM